MPLNPQIDFITTKSAFLKSIYRVVGQWRRSFLFNDVRPLLDRANHQSIEQDDLAGLVEVDRLLESPSVYPAYLEALPALRQSSFQAVVQFERPMLWSMGIIHFLDVLLSLAGAICGVFILMLYEPGSVFFEHPLRFWLALGLGVSVFLLNTWSTALHAQKIDKETLVSFRVKTRLTRYLFEHILGLSRQERMKHRAGDLVNFSAQDCKHLAHYFAHGFVDGFVLVSTSIILLFIMIAFLGHAALIGFLLLILHIPFCIVFARVGERLNVELMQRTSERISLVTEWIQGMRIVRYFGWGAQFIKQILLQSKREHSHLAKIHINYSAAFAFSTSWWMLVAVGTLGGMLYLSGMPSVSQVFAVIWLSARLGSQLNPLPWFISERSLARASGDRLSSFFRERAMFEDLAPAHHSLTATSGFENQSFDAVGFELEDIEILFPDAAALALNIPRLFVRPGRSLVVIGAVGAGKTLFENLLVGELPPTKGRIDLVFFKSGVVVHQLPLYSQQGLEAVRRYAALVPQRSVVFSASVRENVPFEFGENYFKDTSRDKVIIQSLSKAQLEKDMSTFPQGLETVLGERGINLSGGQKQRLSLARAQFHQKKIVVLDDPLSAVDRETEGLLIDSYFSDFQNETVILSTHRMEHLHRFDDFLLLESGLVVECGETLDALLNNQNLINWMQTHAGQ